MSSTSRRPGWSPAVPAGACCWKTRNVAGRSATDAWSSAPAPANCCCLFPAGPSPASPAPAACRRWPRAACHWPASAWWWLAPARCCWPAPPAPASAGRACCASPNRRRREPWPPSPYASRAGPASCGRPPACSPVATAPTATCSPPSARSAWKPCACAKAVGSARSPANAWPAASAWCPTCNSARPSAIASTARRSPSTNGRPAACPTTTPPANAPASAAANWPWWKAPSPAMPPSTSATRLAACGHDGDAGRASPTPWRDTSPCVPNCVNWRRRIPWSAVAKTSPWPRWPGMPAGPRPSCTAVAAWAPARADMRQRRAIPVRLDASGAASAVQPGAPGDPGPLAGRRRLATLGAIQPAEAGQRQQQTTQQHGCQRLGEHPVRP